MTTRSGYALIISVDCNHQMDLLGGGRASIWTDNEREKGTHLNTCRLTKDVFFY